MMPYTLAFAFASLVISTSSVADSFASASIGPLVIQLVDLDLNDNVTPTVAFGNPAFGAAESYVISFAAMGNDFRRNTDASAVPFLPMSTTAMFGVAQASASIVGIGTAAGTTFAVSGSSGDLVGPPTLGAFYEAKSGQAEYGHNLVLSANTQLVVSAVGSVAIRGTGPGHTNSFATLLLRDYLGISSNDALVISVHPAVSEAFDLSEIKHLTVSYSNSTSSEQTLYFTFDATIHGEVYASAVPEPSTLVLLFTGAGFLSAATARRRRIH